MGSSDNLSSASPSQAFLDRFRSECPEGQVMPFVRFMEIALYDSELGYYRQPRPRVGYSAGTDFYTASSSGSLFGELIVSAVVKLLGDLSPSDYTFVEIGTETDQGIIEGVEHPFKSVLPIPLGSPLNIPEHSIVFSNELFDAQPCRRFIGRAGKWHELGVTLSKGNLTEIPLENAATDSFLPKTAPEGYHLDAPEAATTLLHKIISQSWNGLFLAFDYGKSWPELTEATPGGTTRAYYRHTQSNDLLARPGEQDLTCHVCWDWLSATLEHGGFNSAVVESQEAFFIHHAGSAVAEISAQEATRTSPRKLALMQLLHPAHLGQKFQVLHALRFPYGKDS
jgi:SAM-dependent MidA family methyltransferase